MKKFILLFLLFSKLTFSQELVNSIDINLDKIKSFYRIEDPNNNDYALILKNKENIELIKADKSFNVLSRFEHTEIDKSGDFIGNSIKENLFYTYWKKNKKTLEVLTIDFENKKIIKNEINYPIESNEKTLSSYTKDAFFNVITVTKEAAIINDGSGSSITSYSDKVVVYIRSCISSSNFKPTDLKNVTSNYDNVRSYVENNNLKENFLTLFESNNHFYLFAHKNKQEKVTIYKF